MLNKAAILLTLTIASPNAIAQVTSEVIETYYPIYGTSAAELIGQRDRKSPVNADAYTARKYDWEYRYTLQDGRCAIQSVSTHVVITYLYPKWVNETQGDWSLRQRWRQYIQALMEHEHVHGAYNQQAAYAIDQSIKKLSAKTCDALGKEINRTTTAIIRRNKQKNVAYDERTEHGVNQGVIFY